ncbi:response regulator [Niveispirillum irakense]|uniref:response regulator n=1 Tax=Niveispirillum irakense TaxID=34011 RepID=UPI0004200243|nr:response regulator [Niveispirillum irakense]
MTFRIPPYSFPTTVAAVDDDAHFLESLAFSLGRALRCDAFEHPATALSALVNRDGRARIDHLLAPLQESDLAELPGDWTDRGVRLHCSRIVDVAGDPTRHQDVSAIIADYDMPGMDGLSFFRGLESPAAKRILLTGKADERVAIHAFNEGLIDLFFMKHDPTIRDQLRTAIADAPQHYFRKLTRPLLPFFDARSFLHDPFFERYVTEQFAIHGIVEHYLSLRPSGLLCFDAQHEGWLLLAQAEEDVCGIMEAAGGAGYTQEGAAAVARGELQPLPSTDNAGVPGQVELVPCIRLQSQWRCSFIPAPPHLRGLIKYPPPARFQRYRQFATVTPNTAIP